MKSKIKLPLVIFSLLLVLGIISATIYYFNTRETNKLDNTVKTETVEKNVSENSDEDQNVVSTEKDSSSNEIDNEELTESSKSDNQKEDNSNSNIKTDTSKNSESSSKNNTTSKTEQNNNSSSSSSSQQNNSSNNTEIKEESKTDETGTNENTSNSDTKEEQDNSNVYEVPDEDNKDNVSSFENDEEYIKLKATIEFETRAECQAAADIIGPQYAIQGNLRNTSCKSFAYKGTVIGYRLQIWFTDGTWIYNNS